MYVKKFDSGGKLLNPITKENPFVNQPKIKKEKDQRKKSRMIVLRFGKTFYRYQSALQKIGGKTIYHSRLVSSSSLGKI